MRTLPFNMALLYWESRSSKDLSRNKIKNILGDRGPTVSWVGENGGEKFQEQVREPLGSYS